MNLIITTTFLFLFSISFSQITISEGQKNKKPSRPNLQYTDPIKSFKDINSNFYISMNISSSFRDLKTNEEFLYVPLNERVNETPLNTNSFILGINSRIFKGLGWDGAISFMQNGEQYSFSEKDTSFSYKTKYTYFSMPIRIHYNFDFTKRIGLKLGAGIIPSLFINYKQDQNWETLGGSSESNFIQTDVGFNSAIFNLNTYLYFTYRLSQEFGFFIGPEYRYQLSNSYQTTADYKHYTRAFGVTFGFCKRLNN